MSPTALHLPGLVSPAHARACLSNLAIAVFEKPQAGCPQVAAGSAEHLNNTLALLLHCAMLCILVILLLVLHNLSRS